MCCYELRTGDCGAAEDVWKTHGYGGNASGAAAASITAGMDVDCGSFVAANGLQALKNGQLSRQALDSAVSHLFRLRIRLGYFDPIDTTPWGNASYRELNYTAHYAESLRAAREGIVLLSHRRNILPLEAKTLAVAGPNADNPKNMQGVDCHGVAPYLITPRQGLANYSNVSYALGCSIGQNDTSGFEAATRAAQSAEATVLVLGLDPSIEYEMRDRTDLLLPGVQAELVRAVRTAMGTEKPLVVALMGGGVIDTSSIDDLVDAMLWVGYPGNHIFVRRLIGHYFLDNIAKQTDSNPIMSGQSGGQALAEILFGDVIPSGRTPLTWYHNDYASDSATAVSMLSMNMRPDNTTAVHKAYPPHGHNPGRTYRFLADSSPFVRYPFGHGLSYGAKFTYNSHLVVAPTRLSTYTITRTVQGPNAIRERYSSPVLVNVTVVVSNSGHRAAGHSVLLYAAPPNPGTDGNPIKSLVAFERIPSLSAGESVSVTFPLTAWSFALANTQGTWDTAIGTWKLTANNGDTATTSVCGDLVVVA